MNSKNNYLDHIRSATRIYKQEQSFPAVYRRLIKKIDPDLAIKIISELKKTGVSGGYYHSYS